VLIVGQVVVQLEYEPCSSGHSDCALQRELGGARAGDPSSDERGFDPKTAEAREDAVRIGERRTGARSVDTDEDVVDYFGVLGQDLECLKPVLLREAGVDGEADELVLDETGWGRGVLPRGEDLHIGVFEVEREGRWDRGRISWVSEGGAARYPSRDRGFVGRTEARVLGESPGIGALLRLLSIEGRHRVGGYHRRDYLCLLLGRVGVVKEDVRLHAIGVVAIEAIGREDWCDILVVGDIVVVVVRGRRLRTSGENREQDQGEEGNGRAESLRHEVSFRC
jgi:hypothetical protein